MSLYADLAWPPETDAPLLEVGLDALTPAPEPLTQEELANQTRNLIDEVSALVRRFVILPNEDAVLTIALFVLHTWALGAAFTTPYIVIESPEKQSGKTQLQRVIGLVAKNAINTASISAAALYQVVSLRRPTLLIDEVDAIFGGGRKDLEDLRGALNAGWQRGTPFLRGGPDGEPREHDVFCAKVLSGIATGKLPATIRDRAVVIEIERKLKVERVERWKAQRMESEGEEVRARLEAWAKQAVRPLKKFEIGEPIMALSDRQEDAWEPLLAIAQLSGEDTFDAALKAAKRLSARQEDDAETDSHKLLVALRDIFGDRDRMSSAEIVAAVNNHPTLTLNGGPVDQRAIARLLKPYKVIPRTVRQSSGTRQGYQRHQLEDAWGRYAYANANTSTTSSTTPVVAEDSGRLESNT